MSKKTQLWVCGQFRASTNEGVMWDFQGVFSDRAQAVEACKNERYFIAPVFLDCPLPDERSEWPNAEYPLATQEESNQ